MISLGFSPNKLRGKRKEGSRASETEEETAAATTGAPSKSKPNKKTGLNRFR